MKLQKIALVSSLVVSGITVSSVFSSAKAAIWNFSYTGSGFNNGTPVTINASGTLTTDTAGTLVTGITGSKNGSNITSLVSILSFRGNDNVFVPSGIPAFVKNGVGFQTADGLLNGIGYSPAFASYEDSTSSNASPILVTATFTPVTTSVPEPLNILGATAGLLLFGTVSTALKRRKVSK